MTTTIAYKESAFCMPAYSNWQDVHSQVYHVAMNGEDRTGHRDFIYSVEEHRRILGDQMLVTLRSAETLPVSTRPSPFTLDIGQGQRLALTVVLSRLTSVTHPDATRKRTMTQQAPYEEWFARTMRRAGLRVEQFRFANMPLRMAHKGQTTIRLPSARFIFFAKVIDLTQFARAWQEGIGAKRGYGFGLLELATDD
ncbi:MAG: type I-E CRISPR-associated protein Cas6/Cse3/CasE [Pseudomonadales bacterium]